jgi:hypothetical protein
MLAARAAVAHLLGGSPLGIGQHNFGIDPLTQAILAQQSGIGVTNPFAQQGIYPLTGQVNPFGQFGQAGQLYGQAGQPFGQIGQPYGQQQPFGQQFGQVNPLLAPQSWVGQAAGFGQGFGQIHPLLAQQAIRGLQGGGLNPWSTY